MEKIVQVSSFEVNKRAPMMSKVIIVTPFSNIAICGGLGDNFNELSRIAGGDGRKKKVKEARKTMRELENVLNDLSEVAYKEGLEVREVFGE